MKKKINLVWPLLVFLFSGCNNVEIVGSRDIDMTLIFSGWGGRVNTMQSGVVSYTDLSLLGNHNDVAGNYALVLLSDITAPICRGVTLTPTGVLMQGHYVYVSYRYSGNAQYGALDVIDVSDATHPEILQSALFYNIGINAIDYQDNYLLLAGIKQPVSNDVPEEAALIKMKLNNGYLTNYVYFTGMQGNTALSIVAGTPNYYAVSAENGIVGAYSLVKNTLQSFRAINNLKSIRSHNQWLYILHGGIVEALKVEDMTSGRSFTTDVTDGSALGIMDFYGNDLLVAEGSQGIGIYNTETGEKRSVPMRYPGSLLHGNALSRAVSVSDEHIFVANGVGGVTIYNIESGNVNHATLMANVLVPHAAVDVRSMNGFVFVLDSIGDVKIMKVATSASVNGGGKFGLYSGGCRLNVQSADILNYSGTSCLKTAFIAGGLQWDGLLSVSDTLEIKQGGVLNIQGTLLFGSPGKTLEVRANGILRIEGRLVVYGDLVLEAGAKLEFIGQNSTITVGGKLEKSPGAIINGNYKSTTRSVF